MLKKITEIYQQIKDYIPPFLKNFFLMSFISFVLWMLFFDTNNFFVQIEQHQKFNELILEKKFYQEKIKNVKEDMKILQDNPQLLEKFAREKYYFHKKTEDVYVIVEEKKK